MQGEVPRGLPRGKAPNDSTSRSPLLFAISKAFAYFSQQATSGEITTCCECLEESGKQVDLILLRRARTVNGYHDDQKQMELFVKWQEVSNLHNSWVLEWRLKRMAFRKYKNFIARLEAQEPEEIERDAQRYAEWGNCERIVSRRVGQRHQVHYYIKWQGLAYQDCTWELASVVKKKFPDMVAQYKRRKLLLTSRLAADPSTEQRRAEEEFTPFRQQPIYLPHQLYAYQLEGLNWLRCNWYKRTHCILGDEMGLGKTVQAVSLLLSLREGHEVLRDPFMVVAPLSTIANWQREFHRWAPSLNVVAYLGGEVSREIIQHYEFFVNSEDDNNEDDDEEDISGAELDVRVSLSFYSSEGFHDRFASFPRGCDP